MASSGSFTTSSRGATQYPRNATFNWWQTGQSIDGNYTDIAWNFVLGGGTSNNATIAIYAGSITVNGATTNFNYGGAFKKNGFVLASGSSRIYHNADGTKAFNANGGVNIYGSSQWYGGSQDFWLNTIARASTPSLTNANFNIGDTITINTNRASSSFTHTVKIKYGSSTTTIATGVGASVTYNTSNIADALYALIPNDKKYTGGTIEVTTYNGGTTIGTKSCAYTANAVESAASPLFSNFTYADTNSATTAITGNSAVLISGKSTLAVTISAANKATARKSATMKKYTYQVAGLTGEANYSTSQIVKNMGSPEVAQTELPSGTRDIVVTAVDSRGYSTAVTKRVTIVPYKAPTISASASRLNGFEAETTIKIAGTFSRIEVGGTAKNTVDASSGVQYRYKAQNTTTWGSWTNKTATIDAANGKVAVADFKLSLDNQNAYDFEVRITDRLQTTTGSFTVAVGQPAFYIGADGRISVGGMPQVQKPSGKLGQLEVNGNAYANGKRLAELPITKDMLGSKSVTSDKIDWTTLSHVSSASWNVIDVRQAVTTLLEVTIPENGVYYASAVADPNLLANEVGNANVFLALNNGNPIAGAYVFFNNPSKTWFMGGVQVSAIISCKKGDKIQFRGQSEMNHWQTGRHRLDAFRIG